MKKLPFAFWFILILGFCIRLTIAFMRWDWLSHFIYDDAFYYFAIAKNIALGFGVSADRGLTITNGFHLLWLITILPIWIANLFGEVGNLRAVLVLSAILDTLAGYFIFRIVKQITFEKSVALVAMGLYLFNPVVIYQSMTGMETPLVTFLLTLWIWNLISKWGTPLKLAILSALLFLVRTDMIFIILIGEWLIWKPKIQDLYSKPFLKHVTTIILIIFPWFYWNLANFHTIFQSSGSVYPWIFKQEFFDFYRHTIFSWVFLDKLNSLSASALTLAGAYFGCGIILFAFAVWFISSDRIRKTSKLEKYLIVGCLVGLFYHTFFRWFPRIWYFHPLYILTVPTLAFWIRVLWSKNKIWFVPISIVVILGFIYTVSDRSEHGGAFRRAYLTQERAMVAVAGIDVLPDSTRIGAWNSGYPQYFAKPNVHVINLDGLANNSVIDYYRHNKFMQYCDSMKITMIADNPMFMEFSFGKYIEPWKRKRIIKVAESDSIGLPDNKMAFYEILPETTLVDTVEVK
jgi:hypothetical protein